MSGDQQWLPVGAIVLAAGSASRMGRLKQTLPYGQSTLVQHAVERARAAEFDPIVVVVGAGSSEVRASIAGLDVEIAENPDWQLGMGSSIRCGVAALRQAAPDITAVAILLADQPLVTSDHLSAMRALLSPNVAAVAAEYGGSIGVPAIFQVEAFSELLSLPPESGAKQILRKLGDRVARLPLPEASVDIDTPEDYTRLT